MDRYFDKYDLDQIQTSSMHLNLMDMINGDDFGESEAISVYSILKNLKFMYHVAKSKYMAFSCSCSNTADFICAWALAQDLMPKKEYIGKGPKILNVEDSSDQCQRLLKDNLEGICGEVGGDD